MHRCPTPKSEGDDCEQLNGAPFVIGTKRSACVIRKKKGDRWLSTMRDLTLLQVGTREAIGMSCESTVTVCFKRETSVNCLCKHDQLTVAQAQVYCLGHLVQGVVCEGYFVDAQNIMGRVRVGQDLQTVTTQAVFTPSGRGWRVVDEGEEDAGAEREGKDTYGPNCS
ncbi:hypothetical protein P692DRAFT_201809483 [Suillus brevipes Sb2]|nr:hypothetical protein P692DRAFT_201809483 [Suillus brevipes Sb2]